MKKIYTLLLLLAVTLGANAQRFAVRTDAVWWGLMSPNVGAELTVDERMTIGLDWITMHNPWGQTCHAHIIQPEFRYYFSSRAMNRVFVGVAGLFCPYTATVKNKELDGYALGAGLTFGYVLPITKRFVIDFHAGYGATFYQQKQYWVGDSYVNDYGNSSNARGCYWLPTKIGVSLTYIIK